MTFQDVMPFCSVCRMVGNEPTTALSLWIFLPTRKGRPSPFLVPLCQQHAPKEGSTDPLDIEQLIGEGPGEWYSHGAIVG